MSIRRKQAIGIERRSALQADRILDAAAELDVGVIGLARPVADPDHVSARRVPVAARRILARQRLLVAEQAAPRGWCRNSSCELRRVLRRDAARAHELQRLGDAIGEFLIAMALRAVLYEAHVPLVHALEIGVAAGREGADKVERRCRLAIGLELANGIGDAGFAA